MSILRNCLYKSSFKIHILDPKTDEPKHTLIFFWNLPPNIAKTLNSQDLKGKYEELKAYFGSDFKKILHIDQKIIVGGQEDDDEIEPEVDTADDVFDIDYENIQESDIKNYSNTLEDVKLDRINYITNISVFPEDSFWTIKQKIFVCTNIPIYRQHLFYLQQNYHRCAYSISIQDMEYPITKTKDTTKIMGLLVDQNMNFNKDNIRVRSEETCTIIDDLMEEQFYLYDLEDYLTSISKSSLADDKISFDIIYHSLVKKYFPIMDEKIFRKYLENEQELISSYGLINIGKDVLGTRFREEKKILTKIYQDSAKYHEKYSQNISIEVVEVEMKTLPNDRDALEIRNLIDLIQTDNVYIIIDAYVSYNKSKYRVIKNWVGLEQNALDQITRTKEDYFGQDFIVVYFEIGSDIHSIYIYADGSYTVKCGFLRTHDVNFQKLMDKVTPFVDPILEKINSNRDYLFCDVPKFVPKNVTLNKIRAKIKWSKIFNDKQFWDFIKILDRFGQAGIFQKRNVVSKPNTYPVKIIKGMYKTNVRLYLKKGVESSDYYIIFKDSKTHETWNSRWGGENMDVTNNMINVTFEVYGMDSTKFIRAINYIFGIIDIAEKEIKQHQITRKESADKTNKTTKKKFREIDPKLYDMEDEKGTKYARICQKKHRPTNIYTQDEYDSLPNSERKYTYQFVNYTTGEPVYYKCSESMPFLGFIVGKHRDGYCIPKCKKSDTSGVKNKQIWNICTNKYTINKDEIHTKTHNDNILKFGKTLEEDKVGFCHDSMYNIFRLPKEQLLITGVPRLYENVVGGQMIDILAYQLGMEPELLIESIDSKVNENIWMSVLSASISYGEFKQLLGDIRDDKYINKIDIKDIIVELAATIFGIHVVLFETHIIQQAELLNKTNSSVHMKYTNTTKFNANSKESMQFSLICEIYDNYYPVILFEGDDELRLFDTTQKFGRKISSIIRKINMLDNNAFKIFEYSQLLKIIKIVKKYVWNQYILYVEADNGLIISCIDSINTSDGVPEEYEFLDITTISNKVENTINFLKQYASISPIFISYEESIIGCRIGQVFMWFKPTSEAVIEDHYKNFEKEYIMCNPSEINGSIIKNLKPVQKYKTGIHRTYYDMYVYKLFRCEFYKLIMEYRDLGSHNKIVDKYNTNGLMSYLQNNPDDFPYSSTKILKIAKYESEPAKVLKTELFIEDIIKLRTKVISKKDALEFLTGVCNNFVELIDEIDEYPIDNVLYSHIDFVEPKFGPDKWSFEVVKDDYKSLFYSGGKIKILKKIYPELVRMLLGDMNNYDMFRFDILNFKLMFVINYLNFRNYDNERIIIQSL